MSGTGRDWGAPGGFTKIPQSPSWVPEESQWRGFKLLEASVLRAHGATDPRQTHWSAHVGAPARSTAHFGVGPRQVFTGSGSCCPKPEGFRRRWTCSGKHDGPGSTGKLGPQPRQERGSHRIQPWPDGNSSPSWDPAGEMSLSCSSCTWEAVCGMVR